MFKDPTLPEKYSMTAAGEPHPQGMAATALPAALTAGYLASLARRSVRRAGDIGAAGAGAPR